MQPDEKRQVKIARQQANLADKQASRELISECTWTTSSRGGLRKNSNKFFCCSERQCTLNLQPHHGDLPEVISRLRTYYHYLNKQEKRDFWAARVFLKESVTSAAITKRKNKAKGMHKYQYFLETPELLRVRLAANTFLPRPNPTIAGETTQVCNAFFIFAVGGHSDSLPLACTERARTCDRAK